MALYTTSTSFPVRWNGSDDLSGLHLYNIYYRDESLSDWTLWLANQSISTTEAVFLGLPGHTYHFCSQGVDGVGNQEGCPPICIFGDQCSWPIDSDAQIGVVPWSRVDELPPYIAATTFEVCWSGSLDVVTYDVYVREGLEGSWAKWKKGTSLTCDEYTGEYGEIYYFYSVGSNTQVSELPPYDYDTYTKLVSPAAGGGPADPPRILEEIPPDEAPDRMEEVTRTHAIGAPLLGYIAPERDVDWYRFELTETLRLRVTLYNLPADYDIYVFNGAGKFLWASTWGYQQFEEVVVRMPAGVYYVRIDGYAGAWSGEASYHLLVEEVE
jgi:hypothetical protein